VAIQSADEEQDIWVWDFGRRTLTRLTFGPENDYDPVWTPDGRRIAFTRGEGGGAALFFRAADGTGPEERLTTGNKAAMTATSFSPDGSRLVIGQLGDIWMLPMSGKSELVPIIHSVGGDSRAYLSRDGRWLAYQSNEAGQDQIYVQPFPELNSGRWQVSPKGGVDPAWSPNGRELFYIDGAGALVAVPIESGTAFRAGNPMKLFDAPYDAV
jgi:Tol biopolymer transport system component